LSRQVLVRSALIALALLAVAWLGLSLRATRLEAEGREVVDRAQRGEISPAEVAHGLDVLKRARRLNADNEPRIAEVALLTEAGRTSEAIAVAERIVADEPENLDGWIVLYLGAVLAGDDRRRDRALRAVDRLNPQLAQRLRREGPEGS
jgi:hypothetical protein